MSLQRRTPQASTSRADRWRPIPSCQAAAREQALARTDCHPRRLPYPYLCRHPCCYPRASAPQEASMATSSDSAREPADPQSPAKLRIPTLASSDSALGSSILLGHFLVQHRLHNPDLRALRIVRVRREIEELGVLACSGRVEQIFHHRQRAIVVLNHSAQK